MTLRRSCIAVHRLNHWAFACVVTQHKRTTWNRATFRQHEIKICFFFYFLRSQCLFCAAAFLSTTRVVARAIVYSINNNNKWRMIKEKITRIMRAFAWQKTNVSMCVCVHVPLFVECTDATDDTIHYSIFIYCFVTRLGLARAHFSVSSRERQRPSLD